MLKNSTFDLLCRSLFPISYLSRSIYVILDPIMSKKATSIAAILLVLVAVTVDAQRGGGGGSGILPVSSQISFCAKLLVLRRTAAEPSMTVTLGIPAAGISFGGTMSGWELAEGLRAGLGSVGRANQPFYVSS